MQRPISVRGLIPYFFVRKRDVVLLFLGVVGNGFNKCILFVVLQLASMWNVGR